ncbi:MAG: hypothetical protein M3362_24230, partial [Acidobacteriota bacterium]|nr:hypothetical protein [Acidobacteriota bacterium]
AYAYSQHSSAYFHGKKNATTPATRAPKAPPRTHLMKFHFRAGGNMLNINPTTTHMMKNAMPTAKCRGSHLFKKFPSSGPQKPPMKQGHHRHIESPASFARSLIRLSG